MADILDRLKSEHRRFAKAHRGWESFLPYRYSPGELIPELGGVVEGGIATVLHHPMQIEAMRQIVALCQRSPGDPLTALYDGLNRGRIGDFDFSSVTLRDLPIWYDLADKAADRKDSSHDNAQYLDTLSRVLSLARKIWQTQGSDREKLCVAVGVRETRPRTDIQASLALGKPALVFQIGSVKATFEKARIELSRLVVCITLGGSQSLLGLVRAARLDRLLFPVTSILMKVGLSYTQRGRNLARRLRRRALAGGAYRLRDLSEFPPALLHEKRALIVFVHGLLSTDVGVFDNLIAKLLSDDRATLVGFPHDTLVAVSVNGRELARLIASKCEGWSGKILFVCHSRGGLVARSAATVLYDADPGWRGRLGGCVTFGTPHEGAELAESPNSFVAMFVSVASLTAPRGVASVADVLSYLTGHEGFPGIDDLKPPFTGKEFLSELYAKEGFKPSLDMLALGGRSKATDVRAEVCRSLLGSSDNDLVVGLPSSLPTFVHAGQRIETQCDHFGYFEADQADALDRAVAYLRAAAQ